MPISIRMTGAQEMVRALQGYPPHLEIRTIERLSQVTYDEAFRGAGRHNRSGALLQSLYNRAVAKGRAVGHDRQRAPHALYVNMGSMPHIIRPKHRKALRWAHGGRFRFAKLVRHPGYRGDGYVFLAADAAVRQFASIVDAVSREFR